MQITYNNCSEGQCMLFKKYGHEHFMHRTVLICNEYT